jgi:hypothetical protein
MISVRTTGAKELTMFLDSECKSLEKDFVLENRRSAKMLVQDYKRNLRPHRKTGGMEAGTVEDSINGYLSFEVGGTTIQHVFTEFGTRPHVIFPVVASALAFFWPEVGQNVAFKHVHHPGTKADPALLLAWLKYMGNNLEYYVQRLEQRMARHAA